LREGHLNGRAQSGAGHASRCRLKGLPGRQVSQPMASLAGEKRKITASTYGRKTRAKTFQDTHPLRAMINRAWGEVSRTSTPATPPRSASPVVSASPLLWAPWTPRRRAAQAPPRRPGGRSPALPAWAAALGEQTPRPGSPGSLQLLQPRGQVPSRIAPTPRAGTPASRLRGPTASTRSGAGLMAPGLTPSRG
jgi:hypothetical protein